MSGKVVCPIGIIQRTAGERVTIALTLPRRRTS